MLKFIHHRGVSKNTSLILIAIFFISSITIGITYFPNYKQDIQKIKENKNENTSLESESISNESSILKNESSNTIVILSSNVTEYFNSSINYKWFIISLRIKNIGETDVELKYIVFGTNIVIEKNIKEIKNIISNKELNSYGYIYTTLSRIIPFNGEILLNILTEQLFNESKYDIRIHFTKGEDYTYTLDCHLKYKYIYTIGVTVPNNEQINKYETVIHLVKNELNKKFPYQQFNFLIKSNEGKASTALKNTQEFKALGINLIVGHGWNSMTSASYPYISENDIVLIDPSCTIPTLSKKNDNLFRLKPIDSFQGIVLAKIIWSKEISNVIVVQSADAWSDNIYDSFKIEYEKLSGKIIECHRYGGSSPNYPYINSVIESSIKLYDSKNVGLLQIGLYAHDITDEIMMFYNEGIINYEEIKSGYSIKLIPHHSEKWINFEQKYYNMTGKKPDFTLGAVYDACWLFGLSMNETRSGIGAHIKEVLPNIAYGYWGATGWCALNDAGDRITADYDIYKHSNLVSELVGIYNGEKNKIEWYAT